MADVSTYSQNFQGKVRRVTRALIERLQEDPQDYEGFRVECRLNALGFDIVNNFVQQTSIMHINVALELVGVVGTGNSSAFADETQVCLLKSDEFLLRL